jgi:hypothetical protein
VPGGHAAGGVERQRSQRLGRDDDEPVVGRQQAGHRREVAVERPRPAQRVDPVVEGAAGEGLEAVDQGAAHGPRYRGVVDVCPATVAQAISTATRWPKGSQQPLASTQAPERR